MPKSKLKAFHHHIKNKVKTPEYLKILTIRTFGNFLILSSLFIIGKTFYLPVREEIRYYTNSLLKKQYLIKGKEPVKSTVEAPIQKGLLAKTINFKQVEILTPEDPEFSIVIPKIGANARILANVDASNDGVYLTALSKGVAHTLGTAFPGEGGHIFLFAHSTDYFWNVGTYNAVFYLLNKLEKNDEIDLFYKGQRYIYKVIGREVVDPDRVEYMTRKTNKEFLTLQTCWPPGTTLKRLLVFAVRLKE
ncbi:sortase [Candidatus Roizmanbacteria bacterium]|jgi:sortase A|nr:sortase [Candidatus Roizmanbacteria bacterium]